MSRRWATVQFRIVLASVLLCGALAAQEEVPAPNTASPDFKKLHEIATLGDSRFRHASSITHIALFSDGKRALTSSQDGTARIWDLESGKELKRFTHEGEEKASADVWNVRLLPGEKEFLSCGENRKVLRWNIESGQIAKSIDGFQGVLFRMALHPDNKHFFITSKEKEVKEFDFDGGEVQAFEGHTSTVYTLAVSPDGKTLASGGGKEVRFWEAATHALIKNVKVESSATTLLFMPDGKRVVCAVGKGLKCWDAATGKEEWSTEFTEECKVVALSPDGLTLAATETEVAVHLLTAADGREIKKFDVPHSTHWPVVFTANGQELYTGGDCCLYRWSVNDGKLLFPPAELLGHVGSVEGLKVSSRGLLVSAGSDGRLIVWDPKTRKPLRELVAGPKSRLRELVLSPDGRLAAATSSSNETLYSWEIETGKQLCAEKFERTPEALDFSADSRSLCVLGQLIGHNRDERTQAVLVDPQTGKVQSTLWGFQNWISNAALSAGVAIFNSEKQLHMVAFQTGAPIAQYEMDTEGTHGIYFSENGACAAVACGKNKILFFLRPVRAAAEPKPEDLQRWIAALTSEDFQERTDATEKLIAAGAPGLRALEKLDTAQDPELAERLAQIRVGQQKAAAPTLDAPRELQLDKSVQCVAFHPDGRHVVLCCGYGGNSELLAVDLGGKEPQVIHKLASGQFPARACFSSDGKTLYVGNYDSTITMYGME